MHSSSESRDSGLFMVDQKQDEDENSVTNLPIRVGILPWHRATLSLIEKG